MSYFEDEIRNMEILMKKLMNEFFRDLPEIHEASSEDLPGKWYIKRIDCPDTKGYVAYGEFGGALQARPTLEEAREPLVDLVEEDDKTKIYIELPGAEKEDIQLNVMDGNVEVKTENFHKIVELKPDEFEVDKASSRYKNGVLEITIPKKNGPKKEGKRIRVA
jgi:HSP20 family protein